MTSDRPRLGVLISGRGSNLQAIIDATRAHRLDADVAIVIENRADAPGLDRARSAGIEALFLSPRDYADRDMYDLAVAEALRGRGVDLVCLAGYMRLVGLPLLRAFPNRILNIHPSLLPAFRGLNAQKQALEHGVTITGATVHIVDAELDAGPIVMQAAVPVLPADTVDSLAARILVEEHRIYPLAIERVLSTMRERAAATASRAASETPRPSPEPPAPRVEAASPGMPPPGLGRSPEDALIASLPFARDATLRVVELRAGEGELTARLRAAYPQAQVTTFGESFDVASLVWWDAMFGADLVVAAFVMGKLTEAKKQYLYKAVADRVSPLGGVLVLDRVDGPNARLLHHLVWLRHAGFADVDCRWLVDGVAVFGGFTPRGAAASGPPPRADN